VKRLKNALVCVPAAPSLRARAATGRPIIRRSNIGKDGRLATKFHLFPVSSDAMRDLASVFEIDGIPWHWGICEKEHWNALCGASPRALI